MTKKIIVNKFGGGILKKELLPIITKRLKEEMSSGFSPVAVVSAMPGVTDKLVSILTTIDSDKISSKEATNLIVNFIKELKLNHTQIINDLGFTKNDIEKLNIELESLFTQLEDDLLVIVATEMNSYEDKIVSYGEKLSATILNSYFNINGLKTRRVLAEEIPIITDNNFKNANIDYKISEKNVIDKISKITEIPIVAGFTGITNKGHTTTLGRGGTDTTACFIGAALKASKVILWKDVGGVLSADPKIIKNAKTISVINYMEAEESGKIIHYKAIQYIKLFNTPLEIASIINPKQKTKIENNKKIQKGAKIISIKKDLNFILITDEIIKLNDLLMIVSDVFNKYKLDILLISNTHYSLQLVVENNNGQLNSAFAELREKVSKIEMVNTNMVFLVGRFDAKDVSNFNDLLVKMGTDLLISAFYYEDCNRIEAVIKTDDINQVVKVLHKKFIK
ncbi:MAG: aspartate kinase [Candidatus Nomurabacteria bacterium]